MATKKPTYTPPATFDAQLAEIDRMLASGYRLRPAQEPDAELEAPEERGMLRGIADTGLEVVSGAAKGIKFMTDVVGANNAASRGLDAVSTFAKDLQSAQAKGEDQRMGEIMRAAEDQGVWEQVKAALSAAGEAPIRQSLGAIGTGLPIMAASMLPGLREAAWGTRMGAVAGMGAAQGAGIVKSSIYDAVYERAKQEGRTEEEARAMAEQQQSYSENPGLIAGGSALGGAASATGLTPALMRTFARSGAGAGADAAAPGLMRSLGMGLLKETPLEAGQGGQEQYAGNMGQNRAGFETPWQRGVAGASTLEAALSAPGGLAGGAMDYAGAKNAPIPAPSPGDAIRSTELVPEGGPMTRAANVATEAKAQSADAMGASLTGTDPAALMGRSTDPLAGRIAADRQQTEDAAVARNQFADRNAGSLMGGGLGGSRADPLANMLGDARTSDANSFTNIQQVANNRPPMPASDAARILEEAKARDLDFTAAPHPDGGFVVVPRAWVTPAAAAKAETEIAQTLERMRQADAAPVQRAPRNGTTAQELDLTTDPVTNYVNDLRQVNTPAAKLFVRDFDAGSLTADDVRQRMEAERTKTPDERLAAAAAEGLRMNPKGDPFKTMMAAQRAAKQNPGEVVEVQGGYAIRQPQESASDPIETTAGPTDAGSSSEVPPAGAAAQGALNVQDAPQPAAGTQAQAAPGEAPAPAGRDAAATGGVPDAGVGAGVRADGLGKKQEFNIGGRDPHTVTFEHKDDGRLIRTITYPDGQVNTETLVTDRNGDESWASQSAYEKGEFYPAQLSGEEASTAIRDDISGKAVEPATAGAGVRADGVMRSMGRYGDAMTITQADAKVKELEKEARELRKKAAAAQTKFMENTARDGATRAATLARKLRDDIKDAVGAYPDARAEFEALKAGAGDVQADGVTPAWADMTPDQRKRTRLEQEIATGKTNNGGVIANLRPSAIEKRKQELAQMGDAGRLSDLSKNPPKIDTSAEPAQETAKTEQVKKPPYASKEDVEHLFGVDVKRRKAIERINKGTAYFGTKEKAREFITGNGIKDTHEAVEAKPGRFEVRAKAGSNMQTADAPLKAGDRVRAGSKAGTVDRIFKDGDEAMVVWDGSDRATAADLASLERDAPKETAIDRRNRLIAEREAAAPAPEPSDEKPKGIVGRRADGVMIREDERGVRYYTDGGVRITETVTMRPTRQGMEISRGELTRDFMTSEESAAVAPPKAETAAAPKPTPAANTIFTEDAAAAARARLKAKLGRLNSGLDPEMMMDGITLAGYHIEKGARTFAAYARAMVADLGDGVKPYLKSWYMGVKYDPRAGAFTGMDGAAAVEAADIDNLADEAETGAKEDGNATQQLDRAGERTLAGAPAEDVRTPESGRDVEPGTDGSSRGDGAGNARADDARGDAGGSLGADAGAVPVPDRGTRAGAKDAKKPRVSRKSRGDEGLGLFGGTGGLTPDTGANPAPNAPQIPAPQPTDFTITDELELGEGGQKTKFKNNVAAIRLVRDLEATGRMATPDEQGVLAKYVGWGGLPQAFDANNTSWSKEFAEISELMTPAELAAARMSTRYAHYTSREIIVDGIYAAFQRFGFTGGKTLEAGAGVGNFIGLMPASMRSAGRFTAIEREPFSSAIARQLYPKQSVQRADFTEFKGTDGYFDAAAGNPPFASDPQTDRSGRKHLSGLSLHNYFFAKTIDMLREGGIMGQVVTSSFLDAKGDKARKYISDRVEFLGAIRLPNSAFSKNAGTEVTTDIIFLKKRPDSEVGGKAARADAKRWLDTGKFTDQRGKVVALNQYFIDNPEMMLGEFGAFGTMYGPEQPALVARPGQDTLAMLKAAVAKLPGDVYRSIDKGNASIDAAVVALKNPTVKEGGYFMEGGKLMQRMPDIAGEARGVEITPATQWTKKTTLGEAGFERIKALSSMRATVRGLIAAEMADDAKTMKALRTTLNEQYDTYREKHGLINDQSTLRVFDDDPDFPLLASLEHGYTPGIGPSAAKTLGIKPFTSTAKKGPIFTQRVVAARQTVQRVDTPADALAVSMAERGKLDAAYIGQLLGMEPEQVLEELSTGDKPLLFRDPATNEFVLRDAYLSGNVRAKLAQAKAAGMFSNINALEAVQPEDVASHEITARLGSPWVPVSVYKDFANSLYGEDASVSVAYLPNNSSYQVTVNGGSDVAMSNTWGTKAYAGDALLQAVMNNRTIKVTYRDSDGKTFTDGPATELANEKAAEIKAKFNDWLFADADRSELLTKAYNETNNNYVTRVYDGTNMTFPGKVPDAVIKFRRHQRNAIARIVQDRTALLDHVVGAGKTFTVISGAMELKRTGLARKPMIAVPNHLVKQWAADFYRLYPGANILTATKKDFEKGNRRKFLARIATGDWDAVVIAHSSFGFIQPSAEFEAEFNGREISKIMATIKQVEDADGDKPAKKRTIKQLEGMKERLENRIRSLRDKPMDDLLDFEQIGVDQLFVDEAHMFKNLMYTTKMQGVAGLNDPTGSQRAYDMYVKTNQVMEKNGRGQGVVFATGTPVSNSLAEMYHMMRYLMPAQMKELGFESFDAWANTYAGVDQVWMQAPSGDGFKAQNRMSNFVNTPELLKMFDQVSDTVTMDDIKKAYAEENKGAEFPLPKLKGGRRTPVSLEKSEAQNGYMDLIAKRAQAIEKRKGPPQKGDDNILVVMSDARKAAMDIRLVDPDVTEREKGGRIDRSTDEVVARYRQYDKVKGTQLVFSDLGTPLKHAKKEMVEYEALQARVQAGTPDVSVSATLGDEAAMEIMEDAEAAQAELDAKGRDWLDAVKSAQRGFSIYDDFKAALIEKGIPEAEIAFIHDYNTDDQKASLFRKVNAGQIRVLLGSTAKLGAGTNVQERLVALHHLDVPWRPSDVEQREGRIERQGNRLMTDWPKFEIEILAYVTKDTLDMRMWQVQETKLKMINQLRTRKIGREIDNAFEDMELSAGEMQAAATGDINLLKEIQLRNDVKKLEQRRRAFDGQRNDLLSRKRRNADMLRELPAKAAAAAVEAKFAAQYLSDRYDNRPAFKMNIDGKDYTDVAEAKALLREKDMASEEVTALNGEKTTKKLPLSVTIDGELIKNRATMAELLSNATGDAVPIAWDYKGETYRRRTVLANGIRKAVADSIADESVQPVGTIGAYEVAVEGSTAKGGETLVEVTLSRDGKVAMSASTMGIDPGNAPDWVIKTSENMLSSAVQEADWLDRSLERARKDAIDLGKTEAAGEWPDQPKLDAAREAHKAVLALLKKKEGAVDADGDKANPEGDATLSIVDEAGKAGDTADYGTATQAHRNAAARFSAAFGGRLAGGPDTDLLDAVAPGSATKRGRALASVAAVAEHLFNREVVFVKFKGEPKFNGAVSKSAPGFIFLNVDSQKPLMAVLGHELLHEMAKSQPSMYANLSRRLDGLIKGETEYGKRLVDQYKKQGISLKGLDAREELEADIVGDNFMDGEFWNALAKNQPGLFRRIVNFITKWLDTQVEKLAGYRPFGTDEFLTDIAAAREAVADAMRQFSGAEVGAVADPVDGDVKFSAAKQDREDIQFSVAGVQQTLMDAVPQGVIERLSDMTTSQRGFNRWWHRTVGTQLHKAKTNKQFAPVYYAVQDFMKDVSRMATLAADQAPDLLPQVDSLGDVKKLLPQMGIAGNRQRKAELKEASEALFDGTLRYTRDEDGQAVLAKDDDAKGLIWTTAELKARGMSDASIKMYRQARKAINQSLDSLLAADVYRMITAAKPEALAETKPDYDALMDRVRKAAASANPGAAVSEVSKALTAQSNIVKARIESLKAGANGRLDAAVASELKRQSEAFNGIETLIERVDDKVERIADLKASGYAPLMRFGQYTLDALDASGNRVFFGMYESQMAANQAARKFKADGLTVRQGIQSQKEFELLKGVSPETAMLFAEMMGMEKNDAMQAWLQNAVAEQSALKRHIRRKGVEGFENDASRVVAAFLTSNSRAASRALHGMRIQERVENVRDGDVKDEAIALAEYVNNPKEEAQALRSLLFINYIGGSVASALVNLTQTVVQTFPYLSQYGGPLKAGKRLGSAMKMAMGKIDNAELAAAVKRAEDDGVIKPQEVFQLQAEASRTMGSDLRVRAGLAVWGSFFQMAEVFNRRVAFVAAYQTAKEQGIKDPFAFAENAVDETQGVFNKGNRPDWSRGAVGATLFTFKTFTIQYVEFLKRLPPKEKALALGVLVLLSGIRGLPFAADAEDLIDTVAQQLGYNFTTKDQMDRFLVATLGSGFADFLQHGSSTIPGVPFDVSARLGMADLLPGTGLLKPSETRKEEQVLDVFGVAGGFVRDALKGEFRPIAIRNLAKGLEMYDREIYTDTRGRKVMDVDGVDALMKGVGLQPNKVAAESRAVSSQYEKRALFTKVKGDISEQLALGMFEQNQDKVKAARQKLDDWNEKNPEARIVINSQAIRRRVVEMRRDRADRFVRSAPKELKAATREAVE